MATQVFTNRASSLLAGNITGVSGSLSVAVGDGNLFPATTGIEFFYITLENASGVTEICKATRAALSDTLTLTARGQDGTSAASWTQNVTRVELRMTAAGMRRFIQREGDTMSGTLAMGGQQITNAVLAGGSTQILAGEIVNVPLRGLAGTATNEVRVPVDGVSRATAGGLPIATQSDVSAILPVGSIIMWGRPLVDLAVIGPTAASWKLCDGTVYGAVTTPDMRDKFIYGAGGGKANVEVTVGATGTTVAGGAHTPVAQGTALTAAQLPAHDHRLMSSEANDDNNQPTSTSQGVTGSINGVPAYVSTNNAAQKLVENTGAAASTHTHTMDAVGTHTHTIPVITVAQISNIAVYFIMRVV